MRAMLAIVAVAVLACSAVAHTQTPATAATDIKAADFTTVLKSLNPDGVSDQQLKVVDIGKYNVAVGVLHRAAKATQNAIAHSQVTEIYYVLTGAGTFVTGGTMTNTSAAPADGTTVKILVGPSTNGASIQGGVSRQIGPGDVIIVPPGVAHWFSHIDRDLDYLVFRVDADHVLPAGYVHHLVKP